LHSLIFAERPLVCGVSRRLRSTTVHWRAVLATLLILPPALGVELVSVPYADHVFDARRGSIGQQAYRQLTARRLEAHGQAP
jgi:hypothetical protein